MCRSQAPPLSYPFNNRCSDDTTVSNSGAYPLIVSDLGAYPLRTLFDKPYLTSPDDIPLERSVASPQNSNNERLDMRDGSHIFDSKVKSFVLFSHPHVVLFSGEIVWIFTGVTLPQFLAKASTYGIGTAQLPPEDGVDEPSRTSSSRPRCS